MEDIRVTSRRLLHKRTDMALKIFQMPGKLRQFMPSAAQHVGERNVLCDAHYFNFPTTASIFAFKTGMVKGLAITLLAPNFVARSISSLSLFPVTRIKPNFCVAG